MLASIHIPQELQAWMVTKAPWEDHALLCLFGTNMLVLTSMSTDNLIMARYAWRDGHPYYYSYRVNEFI